MTIVLTMPKVELAILTVSQSRFLLVSRFLVLTSNFLTDIQCLLYSLQCLRYPASEIIEHVDNRACDYACRLFSYINLQQFNISKFFDNLCTGSCIYLGAAVQV